MEDDYNQEFDAKDNEDYNQQNDVSSKNINEYFEKLELKETSKLLINSLRKVKLKIIRDQSYLNNLNSTDKNRYNKQIESKPILEAEDSKLERIKMFEMAFKEKIKERFIEKQEKRSKAIEQFEKERQNEIERRKQNNNRKHEQSKQYFENFFKNHEKDYIDYLDKDKREREKVELALNKKRNEIDEITSMHKYKLNQARNRYENFINQINNQSALNYNENKSKLINSFYNYVQAEKPKVNLLDNLKKTGKLLKINDNYNKKLDYLNSKIKAKHSKYDDLFKSCVQKREINKTKRSMYFLTRSNLAERNRQVLNHQKERNNRMIMSRSAAIDARTRSVKNNNASFIKQKIEFEELFENFLISKKQLTEGELRARLISLIPNNYLDDNGIMNEIEIVCSSIGYDTNKYGKNDNMQQSNNQLNKDINSGSEVEYTNLENNKSMKLISNYNEKNNTRYNSNKNLHKASNKQNNYNNSNNKLYESNGKINVIKKNPNNGNNNQGNSQSYQKQLSLEILDMLSKERERELERQSIISKETNEEKLKQLNNMFIKERITASKLLIEKQKLKNEGNSKLI